MLIYLILKKTVEFFEHSNWEISSALSKFPELCKMALSEVGQKKLVVRADSREILAVDTADVEEDEDSESDALGQRRIYATISINLFIFFYLVLAPDNITGISLLKNINLKLSGEDNDFLDYSKCAGQVTIIMTN